MQSLPSMCRALDSIPSTSKTAVLFYNPPAKETFCYSAPFLAVSAIAEHLVPFVLKISLKTSFCIFKDLFYVCMYVYIYIYIYTYMCVYVCMFTCVKGPKEARGAIRSTWGGVELLVVVSPMPLMLRKTCNLNQ